MTQNEWLQDLHDRVSRGETLTRAETLEVIGQFSVLQRDSDADRGRMDAVRNRLWYARMQFDREAKFKRSWQPEDARFLRGHNALCEALDDKVWGI